MRVFVVRAPAYVKYANKRNPPAYKLPTTTQQRPNSNGRVALDGRKYACDRVHHVPQFLRVATATTAAVVVYWPPLSSSSSSPPPMRCASHCYCTHAMYKQARPISENVRALECPDSRNCAAQQKPAATHTNTHTQLVSAAFCSVRQCTHKHTIVRCIRKYVHALCIWTYLWQFVIFARHSRSCFRVCVRATLVSMQ